VSGFASAASAVLTVDGREHAGWRSIKLVSGLEAAASKVMLELADRWSVDDAEPRRIRPGAPFALALDGETVAEGHLDTVEIRYDATDHVLSVTGRDRMGDLVDCAATLDGPHEFRRAKLREIAERLAQPYGLRVRAEADPPEPFERFAIQPGETGWEALERACRQRAVLARGDGRGGLMLTRAGEAGEAAGPIVMGGRDGNVLSAGATFDASELFDPIVVRGQAEGARAGEVIYDRDPATGDVSAREGGERAAAARAEARAGGEARRYRPRVVLAETAGGGQQLADRAAWEARVAAGRSARVRYVVAGWRGTSGRLWQPNTLVEVRDRFLGLERQLLIASVTLSLGREGSRAELECAPPDAFAREPEAPKPRRGEPRRGGPETGLFDQNSDGTRTRRATQEEFLAR
jgi:prophage tail gpP-like protein